MQTVSEADKILEKEFRNVIRCDLAKSLKQDFTRVDFLCETPFNPEDWCRARGPQDTLAEANARLKEIHDEYTLEQNKLLTFYTNQLAEPTWQKNLLAMTKRKLAEKEASWKRSFATLKAENDRLRAENNRLTAKRRKVHKAAEKVRKAVIDLTGEDSDATEELDEQSEEVIQDAIDKHNEREAELLSKLADEHLGAPYHPYPSLNL